MPQKLVTSEAGGLVEDYENKIPEMSWRFAWRFCVPDNVRLCLQVKKQIPLTVSQAAFLNAPGRTRTCNLRIRSPRQNVIKPCKQRIPKSDLTYTRHNHDNVSSEDPELAKILEVWPNLSDELRKAIVKMISL
ncbi:MAG: hypothetical protein ACYS3N_01535 [Planctomycetota bacterium]